MLLHIMKMLIITLIFYSTSYASDQYIMLNYSTGNYSIVKSQQKEDQRIYGLEYGQKLKSYKNLWVSIEAAYSTHKYTKVSKSFLVKYWGIYKPNLWKKLDFYSGVGVGLSSYKDDDLVKRRPSSSLGFKTGLEYHITKKVSAAAGYVYEHNSGIMKDDNGRNLDLFEYGIKFYF